MHPAEALQFLVAEADAKLSLNSSRGTEHYERTEHEIQLDLASAVATAMLNSMIPVARFRAFIEIDDVQPKRSKSEEERAPFHEFVVCSVSMAGIASGLLGVTNVKTNTRITVWEQRQTGADMISGYQGETKCFNYRAWVKGLPSLEALPTVQ
jgi:hypothetical protein